MNDQEYAALQTRLRELLDSWIPPLGLAWWTVEIAWARDDYEVPEHATMPRDRSAAHVRADWRYGHATVTFNMPICGEMPPERLEIVVVHELLHILVQETRETGPDWLDHEERVVTNLTKAFLWQRDHLTPDTTSAPICTGGAACVCRPGWGHNAAPAEVPEP